MAEQCCFFLTFTSGRATISFHQEDQLCPKPLAHQTIDVEVEAGVEDNEDMVEVSHTVPKPRNGMSTRLATDRHSEMSSFIPLLCA